MARALAREGAELVLSGRRRDVLDRLASELGAEVIVADLAEPDGPAELLAAAGRIDILVANAALPGSGHLGTAHAEQIDRALAVNLRAPIVLADTLIPQMVARHSGQIVFIGSLAGRAATAGSSVYNATKFGLRGFALALRAELSQSGVGVSLITPGLISEAGMFHDSGVPVPRGIRTRRPDQVSQAVLDAIRENAGEIVVAPPLLRAAAGFAALAPDLAARGARAFGGERFAARLEDGQAAKR